MSKIDKRLENTISANTLNFDDGNYIGRVFRKVHNGELTVVRLVKVKRQVYLEYVQGDRKDGFTVSLSEFRKFYHMVRTRNDEQQAITKAAEDYKELTITGFETRIKAAEFEI